MVRKKTASGGSGGVNTHVLISQEAKAVLDSLPYGSKRRIMSQLVEAFADLNSRSEGLAVHMIAYRGCRVEIILDDTAKGVLSNAERDEETSRLRSSIPGDGGRGKKSIRREDKAKARSNAA